MPLSVPSPRSRPTWRHSVPCGGGVELVTPHELRRRRVVARLVVDEANADVAAAVLTEVPEREPRRFAPVLPDRKGATELEGRPARPRRDLEHVLEGALAGSASASLPESPGWSLSRWAACTRDRGTSRSRPAAAVVALVVEDVHPRDRRRAQRQAPPGFESSTCTDRDPSYFVSSIVVTVNDCCVTFGANVSVPTPGGSRGLPPRCERGRVVHDDRLARWSAQFRVTVAARPSTTP